jgi:hypothetical protein
MHEVQTQTLIMNQDLEELLSDAMFLLYVEPSMGHTAMYQRARRNLFARATELSVAPDSQAVALGALVRLRYLAGKEEA